MPVVPAQRILVVDDEPLVCQSIKLMLTSELHQVETSNGAVEAMAKFKPGCFDLVITDFSMPGIKGDQLAQALKERSPDLPIILLTAFPPADQPAGIDLVLTKPFSLDMMRQSIRQMAELASA